MRRFHVYRYDPEGGAAPAMQTFELESDGGARMLLDALIALKAIDPSLAFRRSCREGICGSDAININGRNALACLTNLRDLPETVGLSVPTADIDQMLQDIRDWDYRPECAGRGVDDEPGSGGVTGDERSLRA
jgi:succinate dehydrogenase/fumarate reductase iron-sulfur protein